jgi:hypothetical protein
VTFEAIEAQGLEGFLGELREELVQRTYRPLRVRKMEILKVPVPPDCICCGTVGSRRAGCSVDGRRIARPNA